MTQWFSGQLDKVNGHKPNGTEVVHVEGSDEYGKLFWQAAADTGVKATIDKFAASAKQYLANWDQEHAAQPNAVAKAGGGSWGQKGAAVIIQILDVIKLALIGLTQAAGKLDALAPGLGEIVQQVLKVGQDFIETFEDWFKEYVADGGLAFYLTNDMVATLFNDIKNNKSKWVKICLFAFAAHQARDGMPFAEAYYNVIHPTSSVKEIAQIQAFEGYQLPFNVWLTLKNAGVPVGVAACPALHLEYVVLGAQYANNPSFREMAAQYAGGYTAQQAKQVKLSELWPTVSAKYLATKTNTAKPDQGEIDAAIKAALSSFEKYGGSAYDKWVNYKKDDDPLPYKMPSALSPDELATYAGVALSGYYLTPMQQVRVDATKDGYARLGLAIVGGGGLPAGMVSQASIAKQKAPDPITGQYKDPQVTDKQDGNTAVKVVGGAAAVVAIGALV